MMNKRKWSLMSVYKMPDNWSFRISFEWMLSIIVAEFAVTRVGLLMKGTNEWENIILQSMLACQLAITIMLIW